ncbi:MAG: hypothetical protein ACREYE_02475 [Gammaproteobacteria bacterium]
MFFYDAFERSTFHSRSIIATRKKQDSRLRLSPPRHSRKASFTNKRSRYADQDVPIEIATKHRQRNPNRRRDLDLGITRRQQKISERLAKERIAIANEDCA